MEENIKKIKADLKAKLGSDYEVIIKQKSTKQMREKTKNEINEIKDKIISESIDMSDKNSKIEFLKDLYNEGFSVIALKEVFGFKNHSLIYYYINK
jgi:hypothetical protein